MSERNLYDEYEAFLDEIEREKFGVLPKVTTNLIQNNYAVSIAHDKKFKKAWDCIGRPRITGAKAKCFTSWFKYVLWSVISLFVNKFTRQRIFVYKVSEDVYKVWKTAQDNPSDENRDALENQRDCKGRRIYQPIYFRRVSGHTPENGWIHDFIYGWNYWINGVKQNDEVAEAHLDELRNPKKKEAVC